MRDRATQRSSNVGGSRVVARERYAACSEFFSLAVFGANLVDTRVVSLGLGLRHGHFSLEK